MRELITLLGQKGFTVYLNSGSDTLALMAICPRYGAWGSDRCIGTDYELEPQEREGKVVFVRGGRLAPGGLNLGEHKAT